LVDFVEIVFVAILITVLVVERDHYELPLSKVAADTEAELRLAVSLLVALPLAGGVLLLNLLLNAIHVLGGHGQVTLAAEREDGQLLLRVEDEGLGFPEEMLRAGVRPFATGRAGGTGWGWPWYAASPATTTASWSWPTGSRAGRGSPCACLVQPPAPAPEKTRAMVA